MTAIAGTTRWVADGPLIANEGRWVNGRLRLTPGGTLPTGTPITLTGEQAGPWVQGQSPWMKANGFYRWLHEDYLSSTAPKKTTAGRPSVAGGSVTVPALSGVAAWASDVEGTRIDVDGKWGAQCVDLSKAWAFENGAPAGAYGNGVDVARGLSRLPGWRFEPGSASPRPGWIGSWGRPFGVDRRTGEVYGHTAVVTGVPSGGRVPVIQQDGFDENTVATRTTLPLEGAVGWAVPPTDKSVPDVVVRPGDTLSAIAKRVGVPVDKLARVNKLSDPNNILVGQILKVAA